MIDFARHPLKLDHLNVRVETRGDEDHPMLDLKMSADLPNTALDRLSPTLRESLFAPEDQADMLGPDPQHMPVLKNPQLGVLHWAGDIKPVAVTLHLGSRARDDLLLGGGKLGKVTLRPQNGGTFGFAFRLQIEPTNNEVSKLMQLLKHEVPATLDCGQAQSVTDDEDE